jgi:hypothetical protein
LPSNLDTHRTLPPTSVEGVLFSSAQAFPWIVTCSTTKQVLTNLRWLESLSRIFSLHSGMKLEISSLREAEKNLKNVRIITFLNVSDRSKKKSQGK